MTLLEEFRIYETVGILRKQLKTIVEKKHKLVHETLLDALNILCSEEANDENRKALRNFLDIYQAHINKCYIEYCK